MKKELMILPLDEFGAHSNSIPQLKALLKKSQLQGCTIHCDPEDVADTVDNAFSVAEALNKKIAVVDTSDGKMRICYKKSHLACDGCKSNLNKVSSVVRTYISNDFGNTLTCAGHIDRGGEFIPDEDVSEKMTGGTFQHSSDSCANCRAPI